MTAAWIGAHINHLTDTTTTTDTPTPEPPATPRTADPLRMACPVCGTTADWSWLHAATAGDGTEYDQINCWVCR